MALRLTATSLSFLILCLIWGLTWIGVKAGVETVPPLLFAGSRFFAAGIVFLGYSIYHRSVDFSPGDWPRLALASLLLITLCYGPLVWAVKYVDTGTAAVIEMSLTPVALMGFAVLFRDERIDLRKGIAVAVGVLGLAVLFGPAAFAAWSSSADNPMRLWGAAALVLAALTYGLGSVILRPLLSKHSSTSVAGVTTFAGGVALLLGSILCEPGASAAFGGNWGIKAWSGWIFLVLFGSLIGYSIYVRLLRDIGASRAGTFAFVSPIVAVLAGVVVDGEKVGVIQIVGMIIMLTAAWLAMAPETTVSSGRGAVTKRAIGPSESVAIETGQR